MKSIETLTIDAIAYGGEAVGRRSSGAVCFVRGALPGEVVEVEITEEKKRFSRGKVLSLITPSPHRITPACPYAAVCPGCAFQHCTYDLETEWKQKQFERFLQKFPGERMAFFAAPERFFQRNRLKLACESGKAGYRGFDNRTLVPVDRCLLVQEEINTALQNTAIPAEGTLFFRSTPSWSGEVREFQEEYLTETIPGAGSFKVPVQGFFQTNIAAAAELCARVVQTVREFDAKNMLELFCGVGVFSIAAALQIPQLQCHGIELAVSSIETAKLNAAFYGLEKRCTFQAGDAADFPAGKYDLLLLDPPRNGLEKKLVRKVLKSSIPVLVYISCGPDTLQRDLELLSERYTVLRSGALDMFPCTAHFETFTILTLSK